MFPFVLVMAGLIWDLREYIGHRTDLAREMYVVAEMIANEAERNPIEAAVAQAREILGHRGAGAVYVTVVARGDRRDHAAAAADPACDDDTDWCLPMATLRWPDLDDSDQASAAVWGGGNDCAPADPAATTPGSGFAPRLPDQGEHFPTDMPVLPHEGADPATSRDDWPSRNLRVHEWWVVVDTCLHADPGLFGGMVLRGLAFFDASGSGLAIHRRAAWGSQIGFADCAWCEPKP